MKATRALGAVVVAACWITLVHAAKTPFFPAGSLDETSRGHEFKEAWYSKHLMAMGEAPLPLRTNDTAIEIYRFICLRSFHEPFCIIMVFQRDRTATLTLKMLSGAGGYEPGDLTTTKESVLGKTDVDRFLKLLKREAYWRLKSVDDREVGLDGSRWIIEGVANGRYHVVDRWTPDKSTAVGKIGRALLDLADWKVKELY